jgi:hypothetical protein
MTKLSHKKATRRFPHVDRLTTVLIFVLLAFAVTAVSLLAVRALFGKVAQAPGTPVTDNTSAPTDGVVAYCFRVTTSCSACTKFEKWTTDAIQKTFTAELADKTLTWRVVNTEEPANVHFTKEYQLGEETAVVLVRYADGKPGKSENLNNAKQFLSDQKAFTDYITSSTRSFLESTQ